MFDRISVREHHHPRELHTHEHKAPTDASIAIYAEMKEKAAKSVIEEFKLPNNVLDGIQVIVMEPTGTMCRQVSVRFRINGTTYQIDRAEEPVGMQFRQTSVEHRIAALEDVSKKIAELVLHELIQEKRL